MATRKPVSERLLKMKVATDLPVDLLAQFDGYCRRTGIRKTDAFEIALRRWLAAEYEREVDRG